MKKDFGGNRREAFRVDDLVGLDVRILDEKALALLHVSFETQRLKHTLRSHIGHHRDSQSALLKRIGRRQPDIAAYLVHLEEQLSRLADQIGLVGSDEYSDSDVMNHVSLSANGMRFDSKLAIEPESFLELVIRLMPGSHMIYVIAEVVRAEPVGDDVTRVSVRFDRLHREDEDLLTRHIVRVQQKELQSRRQAG